MRYHSLNHKPHRPVVHTHIVYSTHHKNPLVPVPFNSCSYRKRRTDVPRNSNGSETGCAHSVNVPFSACFVYTSLGVLQCKTAIGATVNESKPVAVLYTCMASPLVTQNY